MKISSVRIPFDFPTPTTSMKSLLAEAYNELSPERQERVRENWRRRGFLESLLSAVKPTIPRTKPNWKKEGF